MKCPDPFSPQIQLVLKKTEEAAKGYLTIHPGETQSIIWHLALLKVVFCANRVSEDGADGAAANPIEIGHATIILDAAIGVTRIADIVCTESGRRHDIPVAQRVRSGLDPAGGRQGRS